MKNLVKWVKIGVYLSIGLSIGNLLIGIVFAIVVSLLSGGQAGVWF